MRGPLNTDSLMQIQPKVLTLLLLFLFLLFLNVTRACLPPTGGRGLVWNVEAMQIWHILLQALAFTALL